MSPVESVCNHDQDLGLPKLCLIVWFLQFEGHLDHILKRQSLDPIFSQTQMLQQ